MTDLQAETVLQVAPHLVRGEIDGDTVAMSVETGRYYHLNETAGFILAALDEPRSVAELSALLSQEFEIDPETCAAQVLAFVGELLTKDVVAVQA
ncbi:MAG: PqqD family protein [Candidatus Eremiobacteraeota bacterium]|nr:PqqD family protein [Candidatus Eremiobacteraeota bacterium]